MNSARGWAVWQERRSDRADLFVVGGRACRLLFSRWVGGFGRRRDGRRVRLRSCTFFGVRGRGLRGLRPLHLLRALLGDDDVALLLCGGLLVDRLQRVGPGLTRRLAGAGRIELAAKAECVRQRRVRRAVDRDRLVDVLAGIAIGVECRFRRRTQRLAGLLVVGESRRHRRKRDREIAAVAGAHADGTIGSGRRTDIAGDCGVRNATAEQIAQETAGRGHGVGILRPAIVLRQRDQDRTALVVAIGVEAAGAQLLEARGDLIEIGAHLLDLGVDWPALGGLAVEQREEAGTVATHAFGLRPDAVELTLLPGGGILVAADLIVLGRIGAAAALDGR